MHVRGEGAWGILELKQQWAGSSMRNASQTALSEPWVNWRLHHSIEPESGCCKMHSLQLAIQGTDAL